MSHSVETLADILRTAESLPATTPVSVIVTVTERPESLAELYKEYRLPLRASGRPFAFLFVVGAQWRALTAPLADLAARGEPIRVLEVGERVSEAAMLKLAVARCRDPILVTLPAYARVKASALPELIAAVEQGAELALAHRWPRRDPWVNRMQNRIFNALARRLGGTRLHDLSSGVRAMRRHVLEELPLYGEFSRFLPLLAMREGYRVVEIPSAQHPNDAQARVYRPGVYVRRAIDLLGLIFLLRFTERPLRFFGLIGTLLAAAGSVLLLFLLVQRLGGEGIAARPALLLSVLFVTLGIQAIALGLVGEIIVHLNASRRRGYRTLPMVGEPRLVPEVPEPQRPEYRTRRSDEVPHR